MQDLLVEWFGTSGATAARYVIAFVVVLVLLLGLRWILRSFSGGSVLRSRNGRQPRLAVMDVTAVDQRRRLVLVRRDNVEHLILIGGPSDIVVEQTIIKGVPVGTMGRIPRAAPADAPADAPRKAVPQEPPAPAVAAQPAAAKIAATEAAPALEKPEPSPQIEARRPSPEPARVEPARPAAPRTESSRPEPSRPEPSRPSEKDVMPPLAGPPIEMQAPVPPSRPEQTVRPQPVRSLATPTIRHGDPQKPYVPPAPSRPTARPEPVATAPIVTSARPPDRAAPPPVDDTDGGFDDLALRLDEALRADIAPPSAEPPAPRIEPALSRPEPTPAPQPAAVRPIRATVAPPVRPVEPPQPEVRPVEVRPVETVRPVAVEPPAPVEPERPAAIVPPPPPPRPASTPIGGASTWFRPRNPAPGAAVTPPPPPPPVERARAPEPEPEETPTVSLAPPADERRDDRVEPVVLGLKPVTDTPPPVRIPDVEPDRLARTGGGAPVLPAVEIAPDLPPPNVPAATVELGPVGERDIGSSLADDLARILVDEEPSARDERNEPGLDLWVDTPEAAAKPAPVPVVDTTPKAPPADRKDPDFLSLEDEMARLLDELAGDIGKSSKAR